MNKLMFLALSLWMVTAQAQVQVVEAGNQTPARNQGAATQSNSNELVISLYNQLETLQSEVQTLRGLVEEQGYQLKRLETESRQRYLDLDSRLTSLNPGAINPNAAISTVGANPGAVVNTPAGDVRTTVPFNPVLQASTQPPLNAQPSAVPTLAVDQLSEQDLYRTALNMLLEEGNSTDAVSLFNTYVQRFPTGRLLPNALYWQGEALILLSQYPQARDAFDRVLREFPEDPKAVASMLKLGVVQNLMGDRAAAEATWRDLAVRYPDSSSELALARDYLSKP